MSTRIRAALRRWLQPARILDPVDRRNAPMMQIILLLIGLLPPLAWAHRLLWPSRPVTSGELVAMAMSLTLSLLAWGCLVLIQRGRFRLAVRLFLGVALINMVVSFYATGMIGQKHSLVVNAIWLVMAGLMLGRRELWLTFATMLTAFALATVTDLGRSSDHWMYLVIDVSTTSLMFLFIAIVIDRTVKALRESLAAAHDSNVRLEAMNERLRQEITERERAEQKLVHAQKMKAIGRLASGVAHDFNNVLSVVLGYAGRRTSMTSVESADQLLAGIERAAERGTGIARRLLSLSRQDTGDIDTFDAGHVVRDALPLLRQLFPEHTRIHSEISEEHLPIRFQRAQLDLVLLNIAANARDAMPGGGQFRVALTRGTATDEAHLDLEDTGTGMSDDTRARLFEPFFSTKNRDEGYGLGLAVVDSLIAEAGGAIDVDSQPGRGTRFRIRLPLVRETVT